MQIERNFIDMKERFKTPTAVFLILTRNHKNETEILLQKRKNTGFRDGFWDTASSGHAEKNESLSQAVIRETKEEVGIDISDKYLKFAGFYYNNIDSNVYCYVYFCTSQWQGEPKISEPEKCSELKWFNIKKLPENIIPDRKTSIENYFNNFYFGEIGWE